MPTQQLDIIIAGAGISGLAAAAALRGAGHNVTVYERSPVLREIGQGISIAPNAGRILKRIGFDFERAKLTRRQGSTFLDAESLAVSMPDTYRMLQNPQQHATVPPVTSYRPDLHAELMRIATTHGVPGTPVKIILDCAVTSFERAEQGEVMLANGSTATADLVVAADGVRSTAATALLHPEPPPPIETGTWFVYRFTLPHPTMIADADLEPLKPENDLQVHIAAARDGERFLIWYFCREQQMCSFGLYTQRLVAMGDDRTQGSELIHDNNTPLHSKVDRATLRREMHGFHPNLLKLADLATDIIPLWRCTSRQPLSTHHRGQLVAIGDAAHPQLPLLGWGAATGIEDAGFLGALFEDFDVAAGDQNNSTDAVTQRLHLYSRVRGPRLAVCQTYSHSTLFGDPVAEQQGLATKWMDASQLPASKVQLSAWFAGYDAVQKAREALLSSAACPD